MKKRMKHKHFILFILLTMLSTAFARAQASFDPKGGCLNVVDFSYSSILILAIVLPIIRYYNSKANRI